MKLIGLYTFMFMRLVLQTTLTEAQAPSVEIWDRRFGGTDEDYFQWFQQTKDNSYILSGYSNSGISGNKTEPNWDTTLGTYDFWIVKIDSDGNKQWDKRFGGTGDDGLYTLEQTTDAGYILGGSSASGINGDKSQPSWGGDDFWIVKTDVIGNMLWDKRFGGTLKDDLYALQQTNEGGYILGGISNSGISGDKTQNNWDSTNTYDDFWVIRVDSSGNKKWDRRFGGISEEVLTAIKQTYDGGFILAGSSMSGISGDKTQANEDTANNSYDYWIVKVDSVGNKNWDQRYGGTRDDVLHTAQTTSDGGFILGGYSTSDSSGDKSQNKEGFWVVKIDGEGNKQWDKTYDGGNGLLVSIQQTMDDGYLVSGFVDGNAGADKTENNLGFQQSWIIKTDSLGYKQWDKTVLTLGDDFGVGGIVTTKGCYVFGVSTNAGIGGYKSQPNWDVKDSMYDYWLVKFCDSGIGEGVISLTEKVQLNVYPNPFSNELDITMARQNLHQAAFTITNLLGQTIYSQNETNLSPTYTKMLDLRYLPSGVYWLSVVVDGERVTKEVVKQ